MTDRREVIEPCIASTPHMIEGVLFLPPLTTMFTQQKVRGDGKGIRDLWRIIIRKNEILLVNEGSQGPLSSSVYDTSGCARVLITGKGTAINPVNCTRTHQMTLSCICTNTTNNIGV